MTTRAAEQAHQTKTAMSCSSFLNALNMADSQQGAFPHNGAPRKKGVLGMFYLRILYVDKISVTCRIYILKKNIWP